MSGFYIYEMYSRSHDSCVAIKLRVFSDQILDGSAQIKFSFIIMIVNMFAKAVSICYISFAVVDEYNGSKKPDRSMPENSAHMEREKEVESNTMLEEKSNFLDDNPSPWGDGLMSPIRDRPIESFFPTKRAYFRTPSP